MSRQGRTGKSDPPTSGAPGFGEQRISWDPRAPHGTGTPSTPPVIDPFPPLPDNPPPISGSGSAGCQVQIRIDGSYAGTIVVGPDGTWTWTPAKPLPPGEHCVTARQSCPGSGWSEWSTEECFTILPTVPPSDQTIDFTDRGVSWMGSAQGPVPGVLAFNIGGKWVYGVLRKLQETRA